jgi:hypothetical protein
VRLKSIVVDFGRIKIRPLKTSAAGTAVIVHVWAIVMFNAIYAFAAVVSPAAIRVFFTIVSPTVIFPVFMVLVATAVFTIFTIMAIFAIAAPAASPFFRTDFILSWAGVARLIVR